MMPELPPPHALQVYYWNNPARQAVIQARSRLSADNDFCYQLEGC